MGEANVGALDIGIFIGYFVIITAIGFYAGRKKKENAHDYFVTAGRLPWYLIGFGIIASSVSTEQFVGSAGYAYFKGLVVLNWSLCNWPALLILLLFFLPLYLRHRITTVPQYLEKRFGTRTRTLYAVISVLTYVFICLAGVIFSGGWVVNRLFGMDIYVGIWLMTIVAGTFTVYGGLISVVWTQMFQAVMLIGAGLLLTCLGISETPGGFSEIIGAGQRAHLILPASDPDIPWTGLLVLIFPVNIWYFCSNQYIAQSCLGAKTQWDGKMGIIFSGFLLIFIAMAVEFQGLIAYALNPNLTEPDEALPYLVATLIPVGLKGLVIAALCGAVMSTIEALTTSASAIFTLDLYKNRFVRNASDQNIIRMGRISGATVLLFGALWAPVVGRFGTIFEYFQHCWAFIAAPVATVFVLGISWKRATEKAAFWTLMLCLPGFIFPYIRLVLEERYGLTWNAFNLAGIYFIFSIFFMITVSVLTKPPKPEEVEGYTWRFSMTRLPAAERAGSNAWYKKLWLWSTIMVIIYVIIYAKFW